MVCGVPTEVLWAWTSPDLIDLHQLNDDGMFRKSPDVVAGGTTRSSLCPFITVRSTCDSCIQVLDPSASSESNCSPLLENLFVP